MSSRSPVTDGQLRYVIISIFGLIMYTTLLSWMDLLQSADVYEPPKPNTNNVTALNSSSNISSGLDPESGGVFPAGPVEYAQEVLFFVVDIITIPIDIVVTILITWSNVWDVAGFASVFVIAPMLIMIIVIIAALLTFISIFPTT